jgi:acyl-CoA dehydrogenase
MADLEQRQMLADTADRLFADAKRSPETEAAGFDAALWAQAVELGLPSLLVPEGLGGAGGDWEDACVVLQAAAYHAVPLPLAEHLIATQFAAVAGIDVPVDDPRSILSFASSTEGRFSASRAFEGRLIGVPWGRYATGLVALQPDRPDGVPLLVRRDGAFELEPALNAAGEPRDTLVTRGSPFVHGQARPDGLHLHDRLALARCAQIAGALRAALQRSVEYAGTRKQFGRAIGQFQAVQQQLAQFGTEVAAASAAATAACRAVARLGKGVNAADARFAIGAAKLRCNLAIGVGTSTAHQVHAAIGFTHEYDLRRSTQRLWSWRSEAGNDRYWSEQLGRTVCARGAEHFWSDLTARDDAASAPRSEAQNA